MRPGDVISHSEMCVAEKTSLQRGMNFRLGKTYSVILMSVREGAPYADRVEENGRVLIYEGHDEPRREGGADPKKVDQPLWTPGKKTTENSKFFSAAKAAKEGRQTPELVKVYEKVRAGIWVYNGLFALKDAWTERVGQRSVFKFRLELLDELPYTATAEPELEHARMIPSTVKQEVWKRDKGRCVQCGAEDNLHFDHLIPYARGGSSLVADNIQILCARHNLAKSNRIV